MPSRDIDNALSAKLIGDATLMTLVPGGVYFDEGPANQTRYVVVSLVTPSDTRMFGGRAFEENIYLVKAVMRSDSGGNIAAAEARIDALLEDGTLTVPGYTLACMQRFPDIPRIRTTERDDKDASLIWQHAGGYYEVWMSPS